jgi:hypothetical protein
MSQPAAAARDDRFAARDPQSAAIGASGPARNDWILHVVLLFLCSGILVAAFCLSASETTVVVPFLNRPLPEICMLRRLTGLSCPGCGLTRCFISLAHGDFASAWSFNPAGLWLFAIVAAQLPWRTYQLWRIARGQRQLAFLGLGQIALAVFIVLLLGQWLLRLLHVQF